LKKRIKRIKRIKRTVTVLPRRIREEQSPFLCKGEQGMERKTFE